MSDFDRYQVSEEDMSRRHEKDRRSRRLKDKKKKKKYEDN